MKIIYFYLLRICSVSFMIFSFQFLKNGKLNFKTNKKKAATLLCCMTCIKLDNSNTTYKFKKFKYFYKFLFWRILLSSNIPRVVIELLFSENKIKSEVFFQNFHLSIFLLQISMATFTSTLRHPLFKNSSQFSLLFYLIFVLEEKRVWLEY